jgi:signal peptidase I
MNRKFTFVSRWLVVLLVLAACTTLTPTASPTPTPTRTPEPRIFLMYQVSMLPTIPEGARLLIEEVSVEQLQRGDIVVFENPSSQNPPLVKRLIGLPGDTVEVRDDKVYVNGQALDEPYIRLPQGRDYTQASLGSDEYFVMGDNRANSMDSRQFGPIRGQAILGRVKQ